jgi:hypothetical protein
MDAYELEFDEKTEWPKFCKDELSGLLETWSLNIQ